MGLLNDLSLSDEHRLYVYVRIGFNAGLIALFLLTSPDRGTPQHVDTLLTVLTTLGTAYILLVRPKNLSAAVMHVLVPDLIVVAGMTYIYHGIDDAFFPAVIMLAVTYALVLDGRRVWVAVAATTVSYAVSHLLLEPPDRLGFVLRMASLPVVSLLVTSTVEGRRRREAETVAAVAETERLNVELRQRLSELQAVSDITETIHSSLDFDNVGPDVLHILAKVIGVESCCLFVLGKDMSETLFSASYGMPDASNRRFEADPRVMEAHFTCTTVFEHPDAMVLFCAGADDIERITDEDRLVLNAVSSELVVAVENSRLYKLTKTLTITDELTGLHNYRSLQQRLDEEVGRAIRYDKKLSLLMIDVDDFKLFNDANGHLTGDRALAEMGRVLRAAVREVDLVARYGGEEFAAILPETDAAGAFVTADKVREAVAKHRFADGQGSPSCSMTVSIGMATFPTHAADKDTLLKEADDALYRAKHGGKNRVRAPQPVRRNQDSNAAAVADLTTSDEWTESE